MKLRTFLLGVVVAANLGGAGSLQAQDAAIPITTPIPGLLAVAPAPAVRAPLEGGVPVFPERSTAVAPQPAAVVIGTNPAVRPVARFDARLARLAGYRPAPRPDHMVRYPPRVIQGAPPLVPPARVEYTPAAQWDHKPGGQTWTRAVMAAIETHGDGLDRFVPEDIENWCPGYPTNSEMERRAFWAGMFSALAFHESTWRPDAVGGGGLWYGLLQVYPPTARLYDCRATTGEALKNPSENLSCSVRIASYQVQKRGTIRRGMLDWGPFHSPGKRAQMSAWTRQQVYCQVSTVTRPVERPILVAE